MLRSPIIHRRLFMLVVWAGFPKRQRHQSTGRTLGGCISGHGAAGSPRFEDLRAVLVGSVQYKQAGESWWVRRGWAIDQARPLLSVALDQEPSGAATIRKHGAKKCRKHGSKEGQQRPLGFAIGADGHSTGPREQLALQTRLMVASGGDQAYLLGRAVA